MSIFKIFVISLLSLFAMLFSLHVITVQYSESWSGRRLVQLSRWISAGVKQVEFRMRSFRMAFGTAYRQYRYTAPSE
jgi:hypothetical protein